MTQREVRSLPNMMDYLTWRGDLTLSAAPWCEVDSLIMASFSYNQLGDHAVSAAPEALRDVAPLLDLKERTGNVYFRQWRELLYAMADSERFGAIGLHDYVDVVDPARAMQFAAVTALLPDGNEYVAFRGTDSTLVGWREDLNMSFESPVPAQEEAVVYLERACLNARGGVLVGGHSKGGNLAAYAAAHVSPKAQSRLIGVYSFDGPGLDDATMASPGYARIQPVLRSILPRSSIVGLLMAYHPDYRVVQSDAVWLHQHDAFTWQLDGPRFALLRQVDAASQLMDETLHGWLKACTPEQRRAFVDALFTLLTATGASTLAEMSSEKLRSAASILGAVRELDADARRMLVRLVGQFVAIGASNAWEMIVQRAPLPARGTGAPKTGGSIHD